MHPNKSPVVYTAPLALGCSLIPKNRNCVNRALVERLTQTNQNGQRRKDIASYICREYDVDGKWARDVYAPIRPTINKDVVCFLNIYLPGNGKRNSLFNCPPTAENTRRAVQPFVCPPARQQWAKYIRPGIMKIFSFRLQ